MAAATQELDMTGLEAWKSFLHGHTAIMRRLDAELVAEHGLTARDYEALLCIAQSPEQRVAMSALAQSTALTRSGATRLVDGLVAAGLVERVACTTDARVAYAQLTDAGLERLRDAGRTHIDGIRRLFLQHFAADELAVLGELLGRLPAIGPAECAVR